MPKQDRPSVSVKLNDSTLSFTPQKPVGEKIKKLWATTVSIQKGETHKNLHVTSGGKNPQSKIVVFDKHQGTLATPENNRSIHCSENVIVQFSQKNSRELLVEVIEKEN